MRISDWSSDVCSSDLLSIREAARLLAVHPATIQRRLHRRSLYGIRLRGRWLLPRFQFEGNEVLTGLEYVLPAFSPDNHPVRSEERRVGKSVSVRVDLGGRRIIKKNNT